MDKIENLQPERPGWLGKIRRYYRGEMHTHSIASNRSPEGGADDRPLHARERLLAYAAKLGLDFVVFSEHASDPANPTKLDEKHPICRSILQEHRDIDELNASRHYRPRAFSAAEASIFFDANGKAEIDLPADVTAKLDLVIASRHAIAGQREPEKIRESLMAAVNNVEVDIVGHPYRDIEFYDYDWNYFKKYFRRDQEIFTELDKIEREGKKEIMHRIIGKSEVPGDERTEELRQGFAELQTDY